MITPVNWKIWNDLLLQSNDSQSKMTKLFEGFQNGFYLCYEGPQKRCSMARNLPFTIGNKAVLWNKLMKEVKLGRVAGQFKVVPFEHFIQSPIGLVPKDNGTQTRLIFHLSYDFKDGRSVNFHTPKEKCSIRYIDLDTAVRSCLYQLQLLTEDGTVPQSLWFSKSDAQSAFRVLPLLPRCWRWLVMKAEDPTTKLVKYFVDKCLPFGSSISCALFQEVLLGTCWNIRSLTECLTTIQ